MDFIKSIEKLDGETRARRMLEAGNVKITVKSRKTGEHITVDFQSRRKENGRWRPVHPRDASHIFIKVPHPGGGFGDQIGTLYPNWEFRSPAHADLKRIWAAQAAWNWIMGVDRLDAEFSEASECGRCRRELTDPESIARGIGPECLGKLTGSQHQVKEKS